MKYGRRHQDNDEKIADEDMMPWLFKIVANTHGTLVSVSFLIEKMFIFSKEKKNLHKQMKVWCEELRSLTGEALKVRSLTV